MSDHEMTMTGDCHMIEYVLVEYDGPQLVLRLRESGASLALNIGLDDDSEALFFEVPVSAADLCAICSGALPMRDIFDRKPLPVGTEPDVLPVPGAPLPTSSQVALRSVVRTLEAVVLPATWLPTSEAINALPDPLRRYIHDLETLADPAGTVREAIVQRANAEALAERVRELEEALAKADAELERYR